MKAVFGTMLFLLTMSSAWAEQCAFKDAALGLRPTPAQGPTEVTLQLYVNDLISIHDADHVVVEDSFLGANLLGDDTLRVASCENFEVRACRVEMANGDAIDFDISTGAIRDSEIIDARGDGIDLMTSNVELVGNHIVRAGDKGISVGESSHSLVTDCTILDSEIGVGIKDASEPLLTGVTIQGCRTGISSYDKNWRYPGGGGGRIVNSTFSGNERALALDEDSTLRVENCRFGEDFVPPAKALLEGRLEIVDHQVAEADP